MGEIIFLIVAIVLVVALYVVSFMKRKKYNAEMSQMREDLKKGDKVMTDTGIIGEVVESYADEEYKYIVLKSGRGENIGYFTVHANAIYYIFDKEEKQKVVEAKEPIVEPKQSKTKSKKKTEENSEDNK